LMGWHGGGVSHKCNMLIRPCLPLRDIGFRFWCFCDS
jgi:hypothetical protein